MHLQVSWSKRDLQLGNPSDIYCNTVNICEAFLQSDFLFAFSSMMNFKKHMHLWVAWSRRDTLTLATFVGLFSTVGVHQFTLLEASAGWLWRHWPSPAPLARVWNVTMVDGHLYLLSEMWHYSLLQKNALISVLSLPFVVPLRCSEASMMV